MCGRYANTRDLAQQALAFGAELTVDNHAWRPSVNICPTQQVPVVLAADTRRLGLMRWGWQRDWSQRELINAQIEKAPDAKTWRESFARRRCVVPCSGWWEWLAEPTGKRWKARAKTSRGSCQFTGP